MVYGVSQKAIAYPYEIPPEAEGNGLLVTTRQISLAGQVQFLICNRVSQTDIRTDPMELLSNPPPRLRMREDELPLFLQKSLCNQSYRCD